MTLALAITCAVSAVNGVASASGHDTGIPPIPTVYRVAPQAGCVGTSSRPDPPSPGLTATALTPRRIRLSWWFSSLPASCRPSVLNVAIDAYRDKKSLTWVWRVPLTGAMSGKTVLTYPSFNRSMPDVAFAAAQMQDGRRSANVRVLIRR